MIFNLLEKLVGKRVILASGSPRRRDILESIGLKIEVIPSTFEENLDPLIFPSVEEFVVETAFQKAQEVSQRLMKLGVENVELIISADTVVTLNGQVYGKPTNDDMARDMLTQLNGKTHEVITGVTLIWNNGSTTTEPPAPAATNNIFKIDKFFESTKVHMASLTENVISSYILTNESRDKAGAYGIQGLGGSLIEGINGDYYNVVGFPLHRFCSHFYHHYNNSLIDNISTKPDEDTK